MPFLIFPLMRWIEKYRFIDQKTASVKPIVVCFKITTFPETEKKNDDARA